MKIAWFTPFNTKSAIAKVSKFIVENFPPEDSVDIWRSTTEADVLSSSRNIISYNEESDLSKLKDYDFIIYNLGNNHIFHGPIYEVSKKHPGILIIHDYTLHIFFEEHYKLKGTPNKYLELVKDYYGEQALSLAEKSLKGELIPTLSRSNKFLQMPLYEPALEQGLGAFAHSKFSENTINKQFLLPTAYSYLPYPLEHIKEIDKVSLKKKLNIPEDKIIFLSTGIVHPVKRIEKFIEAWGLSNNKSKFYYCIIGDYGSEYFQLLNNLAIKGEILDSIKFLGWTSEEVLTDYLNACDIAVNLRYPNSEGCSYSAVEQLSHGLPLICNNTGFYSELPDTVAFKINLDNDIQEIKQVIESIDSKDFIQQKSQLAKRFSKENFNVNNYISKIRDFLNALDTKTNYIRLMNNYFDWVSDQQNILFKEIDNQTIDKIDKILSVKNINSNPPQKKLGIWFGFPYPVELRREGITRFAVSFATALIKEYDYEIEIWCYDFNKNEMETSFSSIFSDSRFSSKIKIVTEKNYTEVLQVNEQDPFARQDSWHINHNDDNLFLIANKYSEADTFLVAIIYLMSASKLDKKIIVASHDLQPLIDYSLFCEKDPNQIYHIKNIWESAQAFKNRNAIFFSNSRHVLDTQIKYFLPDLKENKSHFIYLPGNFPEYKEAPLSPEVFKEKFNITKPYLFLATQFRPYKNLITLLKATLLTPELLVNYELIFTGNLEDDKNAKELVETTSLKDIVRKVGPLTENDLRNFYLNSAFVVVPTLFEGGFPWQAIEAMCFGKPVLMSKIPITIERLEYEGFTSEYSDFMLFNPKSEQELSNKIIELIKNKEVFLNKQKPIADKILAYDWKKAIKIYTEKLGLFTE